MATERELARQYTERALRLIRLGNGQAADVRRELRRLAVELRQLLGGVDVTGLGRRELQGLLREIEAAIAGRFQAIAGSQIAAAAALVEIEAAWARRVSEFARPASATALAQVAGGLAVFGTPLAQAWRQQRDDLLRRVAGAVRETAAGSSPADQILARVLGTGPRGRESGGLIQQAERAADALAHTTVTEAATDARMPVWRANGVNAFRWFAVLDGKTTPGCAMRHGLVYTLDTLEPINHTVPIERRPPRHYRCRSILLPMAYADDIPIPGDGGLSTFREYFDGLTQAEQADLFGRGRADLFRRGVITQSDLVGQSGQILTLAELRKRG